MGSSDIKGDAAEPRLRTTPQVADQLGMSQRKVWELANCGDLPCVRIGRSVRFDTRDIMAFIERMKKGGRR